MAEEHEHHNHSTDDAGHGENEHREFDPNHHVTDHVVFGLSAKVGLRYHPYDSHSGKPKDFDGLRYEAAMVGPFKIEFTRYMQDLTVVAVLLMAVILLVTRRVTENVKKNQTTKGPLANAVEAMIFFVRDEIVLPIGGKHLLPYTPLFLTYFFLIFACNYSGMVPYFFHGATASISVTGALGGSVLILLLVLGMAAQGPGKFFLNLVPHGVPLWLWPLMFILELVGPMIKCFVLCIRLFANMVAGHLIIGNVLKLGIFGAAGKSTALMGLAIALPLTLGVSILEILVCFLQAYVFTMLAAMFIGGAVHPDH